MVEDYGIVALFYAEVIGRAGYDVLGPASTVDDALLLASQRPPEIALIDIYLADGASGITLARALHHWRTVVIFLSGGSPLIEERGCGIGHLIKPCFADDLVAAIEIGYAIRSDKEVEPSKIPKNLVLFPREL